MALLDVTSRIKIQDAVSTEMARQRQLWGIQNHEDRDWFPILVEEVGEVALALNDIRFPMSSKTHGREAQLREELVHVAAVAQSWLEAIERRGGT